jgi:hypothetical protein
MAKIRSRAKSYVRAAHITFANVELEVYKTLDFYDEARRVLRAAEHCRDTELTPGCLELAAQGWMPVDQMTPIGDATCMQWCRCYIEYR